MWSKFDLLYNKNIMYGKPDATNLWHCREWWRLDLEYISNKLIQQWSISSFKIVLMVDGGWTYFFLLALLYVRDGTRRGQKWKMFQIFKSTNFLNYDYHTDSRNAHSWSEFRKLDKHRGVIFGRGFPFESIFLVS